MGAIAIELAQAYVSITPSLRGAQRQIESELSGIDTSRVGSQLGADLSGAIGRSFDLQTIGARLEDLGSHISSVGGALTKYITAPAVAAAGAVAGITAALGWGRLVALDSAQAQLKGLGYAAADVERISAQVRDAVQGGMTTMAEGTAVAAGALAAGVSEGEELERYIRLVGDAAVGANRPVAEMAQIFNRVQGSGRLMTQELNMIEQGLPGFAARMAESLGVPQDEFRKMVTEGRVSSDQFLEVMDDFAGGMAEAYAGSWRGLVGNTKAWVGIVGETILSGAFQDAKVELQSFQEWLKTDEVQDWAQRAGQAVGRAFSAIVRAVRNAITWWNGLDDSTKRVIGVFAGVVVAAGPVLTVVGRIVSVAGRLLGFISPIVGAVGRWAAASGGLSTALSRVIPMLLRVGGPIGIVVGLLITAWQQSEEFRDAVMNLAQTLMDAFMRIWEAVQPVIQSLIELVMELVETAIVPFINTLVDILIPVIETLVPIVETVFGVVADLITAAMDIIHGVIETVLGLITGDWERAWEGVKSILSGVWDLIVGIVTGAIDIVWSIISSVWDTIRAHTGDTWQAIWAAIETAISTVAGIIASTLDKIRSVWDTAWNIVKTALTTAWDAMVRAVSNAVNEVIDFVRSIPQRALDALAGIGNVLVNAGKQLIQGFIDGITSMFGSVRDTLGSLTDALFGWKGPPSRDRVLLREAGHLVIAGFVDGLEDKFGDVRDTLGELTSLVSDHDIPAIEGNLAVAGGADLGRMVRDPRGANYRPVNEVAAGAMALPELLRGIADAVYAGSRDGISGRERVQRAVNVRANRMAGV